MATLTEYRALVRLKGFDGASDAQVDSAINEARRRLARDHRWSFQEATSSALSTVALNAAVSLASITGLAHVHAVYVVKAAEEYNLQPTTLPVLRFQQADLPSGGLPELWALRGSTLLLYPTPDAVYTLNVEYVASPTALSVPATPDPVFPDTLQDLVGWAAAITLAYRQRDSWAAATAENSYQVALRMATSQDNVRQRQQADQVRSGFWGRSWR